MTKTLASNILFTVAFTLATINVNAQDSLFRSINEIPTQYLKQVSTKIDKYQHRISNKTEKTLTKLAKWENKIKILLEKADPQTAARLFGIGAVTFSTMLQKVKEGKEVIENYKAPYDEYSDKLITSIKYIKANTDSNSQKGKLVRNMLSADSSSPSGRLGGAVTQSIKERKQALKDASIKLIGNSKYLKKINKESFYYVETLKNYKEIFQDKKKAEETAINIMHRIKGFDKFTSENSMLASLFGSPSPAASGGASLAGLQTRANINSLIQGRIAAGGPNAQAAISQNMQAAQAELSKLKDKVLKAGGGSSDAEMPNFKPNTQKAKTLKQRLEYGTNFNISKPSAIQPNAADMALSVGYKLNDKSVVGIGASYRMGFGTIRDINITSQGVGLRSFIDWKLSSSAGGIIGGLFVTGGYEMNYNTAFKSLATLQSLEAWQQSGLLGLSKKLKIKTKLFKETKFQLLYDMLHKNHTPVTQPVIFRVGYNF